jgi:hypothetical protein
MGAGMQDFRVFAAVVGRRAALRYVALGVAATVVSACSGGESGTDAQQGTDQDGKQPGGGIAKRALEALALGTWTVTVVYSGPDDRPVQEGTLTVERGSWTATTGLLGTSENRGRYTHTGGRLQVTDLEFFDEDTQQWDQYSTVYSGEKLPAEVGGQQTVQLPWSNGERSQTLTINWDEANQTLTVSGQDFYEGFVNVTAIKQG